ncbi:MAG TPA: hypothetical protein VN026_08145, partial [Bacteroidia bacterium]|nr:hypothetical protein [Bacteroidia bacterium]
MKKTIILFSLLLISNFILSQIAPTNKDSVNTEPVRGLCGYHPDLVNDTTLRLAVTGTMSIYSQPKSTYSTVPSSTVACGKFRLYYEDILLATGKGFNDPTDGANRRNTLCDVLT